MSKRPPRCTWDSERGWLTPEHERDCRDAGCPGCRPCSKAHCAMRGACPNHVETAAGLRTCPECIGRTRRDLSTVVDLYALAGTAVDGRTASEVGSLLDEASESGVDSEAFVLIARAAAPEQWAERRRRTLARFEVQGWCEWPKPDALAPDDEHHPYAVLTRWDLALREQYGPPSQLFATVSSAAGYLVGLLAGTFPHADEFEEFARSIADLRSHMEGVVHDSRTPQLGRPCPRCSEAKGKGPRLRKHYASHAGIDIGERCPLTVEAEQQAWARQGWCEWPRAYPTRLVDCDVCDGKVDTWHCADVPEHWWSDEDYHRHVGADYVRHTSELPAAELADRIGVPLSRVRKWCARTWDDEARRYREPLLTSRRKGADGRKLYRVADALRLAESERMDA